MQKLGQKRHQFKTKILTIPFTCIRPHSNFHPPSHHCHPRRQEARRKSKEKLNDVQELCQIKMTYKLFCHSSFFSSANHPKMDAAPAKHKNTKGHPVKTLPNVLRSTFFMTIQNKHTRRILIYNVFYKEKKKPGNGFPVDALNVERIGRML